MLFIHIGSINKSMKTIQISLKDGPVILPLKVLVATLLKGIIRTAVLRN